MDESSDSAFELSGTFTVVVPETYKHRGRFRAFWKEYRRNFHYFNRDLTDKNFSRVTHQLVPGEQLRFDLFHVRDSVQSEDSLAMLKRRNSLLVGAQGASLVYELARDQLPIAEQNQFVLFIDERERLWMNEGQYARVPALVRHTGDRFSFHLQHFSETWINNVHVAACCRLDEAVS
jgi:hypothetical protein